MSKSRSTETGARRVEDGVERGDRGRRRRRAAAAVRVERGGDTMEARTRRASSAPWARRGRAPRRGLPTPREFTLNRRAMGSPRADPDREIRMVAAAPRRRSAKDAAGTGSTASLPRRQRARARSCMGLAMLWMPHARRGPRRRCWTRRTMWVVDDGGEMDMSARVVARRRRRPGRRAGEHSLEARCARRSQTRAPESSCGPSEVEPVRTARRCDGWGRRVGVPTMVWHAKSADGSLRAFDRSAFPRLAD